MASTSIPEAVAAFRAEYRKKEIPAGYRGRVHFATTIILSGAVVAGALAGLEQVSATEWLTVPVTFLYANLVEYFGHRGPMHRPLRGLGVIHRRHTLQHHRFFTEEAMRFESAADFRAVLFPLILVAFYLGLFALPFGLVLWVLASKNVALLFLATGVGYFLNYELLHFAYHARPESWVARIPFVSRLRRLHTAHHRPSLMQHCNFNITYPIGDLLFGTLHWER